MIYFVFLFVSFVIVIVILLLIMLMSYKGERGESLVSRYECGFDPVIGSRNNFSFRFFLIRILFLIFDVEISLMLPLPYLIESSLLLGKVGVFLLVLLVGLLYEYENGVLKWLRNN